MDRSEIDRLAQKAGIEWQGGFVRVAECVTQSELGRFAALVAAQEREACAQVAFELGGNRCDVVADAIRARSKE